MIKRKSIALTSLVFFGLGLFSISAVSINDKGLACDFVQEEQPAFVVNNEKSRYKKLVEEGKEIEKERIKQEEERLRQEDEERKAKEKIFTLTFYTELNCENGYGPITCRGESLKPGMVANNVLPLDTKIQLNGIGNVVVSDRGGSSFNNSTRLDVFVPRKSGESDKNYYRRVNNLGIINVKGTILE